MDLARCQVPRVQSGGPAAWKWDELASLPAFTLADGSAPPRQQTRVRVCWDDAALHVRFDCEDREAWGTYRRRDDPIYEEEAVEIFLAPGAADPVRYFEFEVSPLGVLFDAAIHNPTSKRIDMTCDASWDCPGLRWAAGTGTARQDWWAVLAIPWSGLLPEGDPPRLWRANFYRIERPRHGEPELSAWSPTLKRPADFHQPARFGVLALAGREGTPRGVKRRGSNRQKNTRVDPGSSSSHTGCGYCTLARLRTDPGTAVSGTVSSCRRI